MTLPWQPSASLEQLRWRAQILRMIRAFFMQRDVLEVETPLLCRTTVTDPFIQSMAVLYSSSPHLYYLQTSPEYAMKRLLAAGIGAIFQITKAFRQDEIGRLHNPEFSLLEWYRPGFDHHALMDEVDTLLQTILSVAPADRITYAQLFQSFLHINPHHAEETELAACAKANHIAITSPITDRDTWLHLLLSHCIEPVLGQERPCFIYDFPASQSALAKIRPENPPVASRFEVYYQGIELANGFHELQHPAEQRERFEAHLAERAQQGLPLLPLDEPFLAALAHGLPDCAGVALGLDRFIMLATKSPQIAAVLSFDFTRV
jgi:elongation factor P--(R)-beta-lysine ligase